MTPSALAARRAEASKRIKLSAEDFSARFHVEPPAFGAVPRKGTPDVVRMKELEVLANWLESLIETAERSERTMKRAMARAAARKGAAATSDPEGPSEESDTPSMDLLIEAITTEPERRTPEHIQIIDWFITQTRKPLEVTAEAGDDEDSSAQGQQAQTPEGTEPGSIPEHAELAAGVPADH